MISAARTMIHLPSYKILAIDLSYRSTGVCIASIEGSDISIKDARTIDNPEIGSSFDDYFAASLHITNVAERINNIISSVAPNIVLVEVPCFTQSAKGAIAVGLCWGIVSHLSSCLCIEPSALKKWSASKRGDKKNLVKEIVSSRVFLDKKSLANDNIVDAVGIVLMFDDKISQIKYEIAKKKTDFESFVLRD